MNTEERIALSQIGANPVWAAVARSLVAHYCMRRESFTVDELREDLERRGLTTRDYRALGPVLLVAANRGWCVKGKGRTYISRLFPGP